MRTTCPVKAAASTQGSSCRMPRVRGFVPLFRRSIDNFTRKI